MEPINLVRVYLGSDPHAAGTKVKKRRRPKLGARPTMAPGETMTAREVMAYLMVSKSFLYRMVRTGEIPAFKFEGT